MSGLLLTQMYLTANGGCSCNICGINTATKMQNTSILQSILLLCFIHTVAPLTSEKTYENAIKFLYFNERFEFIVDGFKCQFTFLTIISHKFVFFVFFLLLYRNESIFQPDASTINTQCNVGVNTKLAVIIHGWMESCETIWVKSLMQSERKIS